MAGPFLDGRVVRVTDPDVANRLHDKGGFGTRAGRDVVLDLHEAAFLVAESRLAVDGPTGPLGAADLLRMGAIAEARFEARHAVYRDARTRGHVVRAARDRFDVLPRGARPGRTPPMAWLRALADDETLDAASLLALVRDTRRAGCCAWLAIVDDDADVTYYQAAAAAVEGTVPALGEASSCSLRVLSDRAVVLEGAELLALHGFGGPIGTVPTVPLIEALFLCDRGARVEPGRAAIVDAGRRTHPAFDERATLYARLRDAGCLPKTGLKFGVHYRVYTAAPPPGPQARPTAAGTGHAPFLVQQWPADWTGPARELARIVRLAHSVRKRLVLAVADELVELKWIKP